MKILFLQKMPCIRNWKMAKVLHGLGHEVYLGYIHNTLENFYTLSLDCYKETFSITSIAGLANILPYFDVIHVHNEPDSITAIIKSFLKNKNVKLIHDCHDWVAGRQEVSFEYLATSICANTMADLVIYVSEYQRDFVKTKVGDYQAENILIKNYPLKEFIPEKISYEKHDKLRFVYAGGMSGDKNSHRYFIEEFKNILKLGHEIYVYAPVTDKIYYDFARGYGSFHCMGHCSYDRLIGELSKYDAGIIAFNRNSSNYTHLDMGLPNKLFEYISAGLPIIYKGGLKQMDEFIAKENVGIIYDDMDDLKNKLSLLNGIRENTARIRFKWLFDNEIIDKLIPYYNKFSMNNVYKKIEPIVKLKQKEMMLSLEVFESENGKEIGLFGKGHDKDLIFESFMIGELKDVRG